MLRLLFLATTQCFFLAASQVFLKLAMLRMPPFVFSWSFIKQLLVNWQLALSGVSMILATMLWCYILKHFELSVAYPLISISYIFGMLAAIYIFHEVVPLSRWIGMVLIIAGVFFIVKG